MTRSRVYLPGLDALRGVAALAVVLLHGSDVFEIPRIVPHGYLAVDFFVMLSGFVLAHSYEDRLRDGLGAGTLIRRRLHRLYPMVVLGVVAGTLAACAAGTPWRILIGDAAAGALLVPQPFGADPHGELFPIDPPLWSLWWEVVASAILAALLYRLPTRLLICCQMAMFATFAYVAMRHGTVEVGFQWRHLAGGAARIGFSFLTGVLLFRWRAGRPRPAASASIGTPAAALAVSLLVPMDMASWVYDLLVIALAFPLLLMAATGVTRASAPWRVGATLSYPLYVLHFPVLILLRCWTTSHPALGAGAAVLVGTALSLVAAWLGHHLWDVPVRRWWDARGSRDRRPQPGEPRPLSIAR